MFKNYFVIAVRNLSRHKLFSAINILCLSLGITFSMIIGVYVLNEETVNKGIKNVSDQYILKSDWKVKEMGLSETTIGPLAKSLKENYPSLVANYYRYNTVENVVSAGENHFKESIAIGDTSLITMYGFKLLYGDANKAFTNQNSAVITANEAIKLFGKTNVLNQRISITTTTGTPQDYTISAVMQEPPNNSVTNYLGYNYAIYVPFEGNRYFAGTNGEDNWANAYIINMIELRKGVSAKQLAAPVKHLLKLNTTEDVQKNLQVEFSPMKTYYQTDNDTNGSVQRMITTLAFIAFFILLMAVINFVNINIGTSSYRLKEIGLRKVFGSERKQLIFQFITEAILLTCFAALLSLLLYELLLPLSSQVLNTTFIHFWQFNFAEIISLLLFVFIIGFISGIYPAFVLSASNVIHSMKGKLDSAKGGMTLRKTLLVIQFSLAIIIFICALTVSKQVSFLFSKDLGFDKTQALVVTAFPKQWDSAGVANMENIRTGLLQLPAVKDASLSFNIPAENKKPANVSSLIPENSNIPKPLFIPTIQADENYASTFGLHLLQGTFLNRDNGSYVPNEIVLNEAAVKAFGLKGNIAGQRIKDISANTILTVTGVVKDFNYSNMQEEIAPVVFTNVKDANVYRYLTVKLNSSDMQAAVESVKNKWKELAPTSPFEYAFMDDKFQKLYEAELQLKKAADISTVLILIIVLLGIFGVVAFTLTKRTKEIAVRKVVGANVKDILFLFIKDYALLIFIANVVAFPLAYFITYQWLQNYAYRINESPFPFLIVAAFMFIIAFALITVQCFKVAVSNPVNSLKYE